MYKANRAGHSGNSVFTSLCDGGLLPVIPKELKTTNYLPVIPKERKDTNH